MLQDASDISPGQVLHTDVCVVGGGPAGISTALELCKRNLSVILIESGGQSRESDTQDLYRGTQRMPPLPPMYAMGSRVRQLGGTTAHWGGWCRPLDPIDFKARAWIPRSGWPFDRDHLLPYYERAAPICEVRSHYPEVRPLPFGAGKGLQSAYFGINAKRFGPAFLPQLKATKNLQLLLHSTLTQIRVNEDKDHVDELQVAFLKDKRRFTIRPRHTVLAAGGIENPRLLLASDVGNEQDVVGRYFADHAIFVGGTMVYSKKGRRSIRGSIRLQDDLQTQERLNNGIFILGGADMQDAAPGRDMRDGPWQQLKDHLIANNLLPNTRRWSTYARYLMSGRRVFSEAFHVRPESVPNPDSRVSLGEEKDPLGVPRVHVDWRLTEQDLRSVRITFDRMAQQIGMAGLGRVRLDPKAEAGYAQEKFHPGYHHMGATRMHDSAALGVVNSDCRVHGVDNLFVAGSSVFPTYGYANPTLTIVALALRLSDHIAGRLKPS